MSKNNFCAFTWDEIVIKFTDEEFHLEIPLCIKASTSLAIKIYILCIYIYVNTYICIAILYHIEK